MSYLKLAQSAAQGDSERCSAPIPLESSDTGDKSLTHEQIAALRLLNLAGTRIMRTDSGFQVGIWEDLDGPELRTAIRSVGMSAYPVLHLEDAGVALQYKVRRCPERCKGESFASWVKRAEAANPRLLELYREVLA